MLKKIICTVSAILLCMSISIGSMPVYAVENGFVYIKVLRVKNDVKSIDEEIVYYDSGKIYASINFFTEYLPYYYSSSKNAFIRYNHDESSYFGTVYIDSAAKKATLMQNLFAKKEYVLDNIFSFGDQLYLPLAQMAALLKAEIFVETDENGKKFIAVGCCMNSLCDAEYALSKISNRKYLYYSYIEMIDDIFEGSESLFKASTFLGYCGSTIFDLQISNLDFIFKSGDKKEYSNILSSCVLDNKEYLKNISDTGSLLYRFNDTMKLNSSIKNTSSSLSSWLGYQKEILEPYKDLSMDNASLYVDVKDWGTLFSTISTVCEWGDFALKFGSVNEDHKKMLNDYMSYAEKKFKSGDSFYVSAQSTAKRFGSDFVEGAVNEMLKEIYEKAFKKGAKELAKAAFAELDIALIAIRAVALTCKLLGVDITDNSGYNIMLNFGTIQNFSSYHNSLPDNHYNNSNSTESYRLASILYLLSVNQMFNRANKLNDKVSKVDSYFNDEIDVISNVLSLFYLAAQGKDFDSFTSIETLITDNNKALNESGIDISDHPELNKDISEHKSNNSEPESTKNDQTQSKSVFKGWEEAAKDFICNLPDYKGVELGTCDGMGLELLDMTQDNIPEVFIYLRSGTSSPWLIGYALFDGQRFVYKSCDENDSTNEIYPYKDTQDNKTVFISGMFREDDFDDDDTGSYSGHLFWSGRESQNFMMINKKGVLKKYDSICIVPFYGQTSDFEGVNALYESGSDEEKQIALNKMRAYNDEMHNRYKENDTKYCFTGKRFNWYDGSSNAKEEYKKVFSASFAEMFISKYKKGVHDY